MKRSAYDLARDAMRQGRPEVALPLLDQVLDADPDHAGALEGKLLMLHRRGERETADALAAEWVAGPTDNRLKAVARYRLQRREPVAALDLLQSLDQDDGRLRAWRGRALFQLGRYTEAETVARSALESSPDLAVAKRLLEEIASERRSTERVIVPLAPPVRTYSPLPKRVLHMVTSSLPHTVAGYTVRSQAIGRAQLDMGLEPHFVTKAGFPEGRQTPAFEVVDQVPYHRLSPGAERQPEDRRIELYAQLARGVVEQVRPSVLHAATGFPNGVAALSLRQSYGIPVVYEVRGFLEDSWVAAHAWASEDSDRYRWRRRAEIECMKAADAVVTLAEVMKEEVVGWGVPARKVWVVPNAVDTDRFRPVPRDLTLAGTLGIEQGEVTVGYVSSLTAHEGLGYLIEAVVALLHRGHRVRALLVGEGPERRRLEELAENLCPGGQIVFTGPVPPGEVVGYYGLIDVFVVPRTSDRVSRLVTPLKPYEAMAMGIPVVASATPALQEMVIEGETGLTFRPEDPADLTDTLARLVAEPELRRRLGAAGRRWVVENRTWARNARLYRDLYSALRS